jgi:hypothetical protein
VLPGITRTNSGSITTSSNGQVIQNLNVTGKITVQHSNVSILNVKVTVTSNQGPAISNIGAGPGITGLLIQDVEIDGSANAGTSAQGASAIDFYNYTVRRVNIHDFGEGPGCDSNSLIVDSYFHDFIDASASGAHQDGIQCEGGDGVTVRHNTIIGLYRVSGNGFTNAPITFGGDTFNDIAEYNLLGGGNKSIYTGPGTNSTTGYYRHNRFTTVLYPAAFNGVYGSGPTYPGNWPNSFAHLPCDNVWYDGAQQGQPADGSGSSGPASCSGISPEPNPIALAQSSWSMLLRGMK